MAKKRQRALEGKCKLTGLQGRFVESHIIPAALTRPSRQRNYFLQLGPDQRSKKRWSSWYDPELVTAAGEKYLADLDAWAIKELRRHKLVWSGWGGKDSLDEKLHNTPGPFGVRVVEGIDPIKLRLFFLSILWRAAATKLHEFSYVVLPDGHLEMLRQMILNGDPEPQSFYPFQLTQLVTKGFIHNHAGVKMDTHLENLEGDGSAPILSPTYRLYFDGLITHVHLGLPPSYSVENLKGVLVGTASSLAVVTVPFDHSLQFHSMQEAIIRGVPL